MTKKMRNTELVFILDKSGSMGGLEEETIGGFNSVLKKQKKSLDGGKVRVTTVLFDDQYNLLHDRFDIGAVKPITPREYFVEGSTALMDAMGKTIGKIKNVQKNSGPDAKADRVLFVIITDGMENASTEYSAGDIRKQVKKLRKKGWEFLFLGANIDAAETAETYGISREQAVNYHADQLGTALNFEAVNEAVSAVRKSSAPLTADWKKRIEKDYENR